MKKLIGAVVASVLMATDAVSAGTLWVGQLGDQGWYSDDTRNGVDLVGTDYTHAGKPGQTGTSADDAQIARQIQFVDDAPGGTKALKLSFNASSSGKATLSAINTDRGFAVDDWSQGFYANFRRFRDTETNTTLRIGVQSTKWMESQAGFTATRSGESAWDLCLTYTGNYTPYHTWEDIKLTADSGTVPTKTDGTQSGQTYGTWKLSCQSGNSYFGDHFGDSSGKLPSGNKTLSQWLQVEDWGDLLFGSGAKVTSLQLGAGSFGNTPSVGYISYFETSLLSDGMSFGAVPEPGTFSLVMSCGAFLLIAAWGRRRVGKRTVSTQK